MGSTAQPHAIVAASSSLNCEWNAIAHRGVREVEARREAAKARQNGGSGVPTLSMVETESLTSLGGPKRCYYV